jgi:hypothetical protein
MVSVRASLASILEVRRARNRTLPATCTHTADKLTAMAGIPTEARHIASVAPSL